MTTVLLNPVAPSATLRDAARFQRRYSSDIDDLVHDFFVPALSRAIRYDRAVGYFTAGALARLAPALDAFLDRSDDPAPIRVVASPNLPAIDLRHMELGYKQRTIEQECTQHRPEFSDALGAVTWMIQHEMMEFWLISGHADGTECLYHEKIGVIEDAEGDYLTFEGSPNETAAGLGSNIESFPVHRSWVDGEALHAADAKAAVDALFNPANPRQLRIEPFPEALREGLVRTYTPRSPPTTRRPAGMSHQPKMLHPADAAQLLHAPTEIQLRSYQRDAVESWVQANGRGLLSMATGTGKTITALAAAAHLTKAYEKNRPGLAVVVLVPDNSLVELWAHELRAWGAEPACSTRHGSIARLSEALRHQRVHGGASVAVWTAQSAMNPKFQAVLNDYPSPRLLVADECHAFGSDKNQQLLTEQFHYRLGLSATIERHLDPDGTDVIKGYFGEVLLNIGISEAIEADALCHYTYTPALVPLDDDEMQEYARLSKAIGKCVRSGQGLSVRDLEESAKMLLIQRARLLWHARGKTEAFRVMLESLPESDRNYSLIYTAEGESSLDNRRQGPLVHQVATHFGLRYSDFVGDTPLEIRSELLAALESGAIDGLVAMKCLDQGIDVPPARVAHFLASTKNPRQYVQRRGRILRLPKDGTTKTARVFDYIAHPASSGPNFEMERRLAAQEILRAQELAEAADNKHQAIAMLKPMLDRYNLWDALGEE